MDSSRIARVRQGAVAALTFVVATLALALPYVVRPGVLLDFSEESPRPPGFTRGVYPAERTPDGLTFAWTSANARLSLPALPRRTEWTIQIRLRAPRPRGAAAPVKVIDHGQQLATWSAVSSRDFETRSVDLPSIPEPGLRLDLVSDDSFVPGPEDRRELALQIDAIRLTPRSALAGLPWNRVLWASALFTALAYLSWAVTRDRWAFAYGAIAIVAVGVLTHTSSLLYVTSFDRVIWAAVPTVAILIVGLALARLINLPPGLAGGALVLTCWFTYVKYVLLLHPAMTIGDSVFHQNRFKLVAAGNYFFTSAAPGGDFPYPVAFYWVAHLFSRASPASVELMRGLVLTFDSLAGLLLAFSMAASGSRLVAPLMVALWQTVPALFQVQGVAYLTNAFGNSASVASVVMLREALRTRSSVGWLLASIVFATAACLSHVSSFLILVAALSFTCLIGMLLRRWRVTAVTALVLVCSVGLAWTSYYRHFTSLYSQRLSQGRSVTASDTQSPLPLQRLEAHQTQYKPGWPALKQRLAIVPFYVQKYIGFGVVALAAMLIWLRKRVPYDFGDGTILSLGWLAATLAWFGLGQVTPIDLRYYLAAAPVLAVFAAVTAATVFSEGARHAAQRTVVLLLFSAAVAQGCYYMARFLWLPLPR
jgi:hypothetical protein